MTTLEHRDYRDENGFADIKVPKELVLKYTFGKEVCTSEPTNILGIKPKDVEVAMFLHLPGLTWRILVHEKGLGGCCLLDKNSECKTAQKAIIILAKECKRIFKQDIKLSLES